MRERGRFFVQTVRLELATALRTRKLLSQLNPARPTTFRMLCLREEEVIFEGSREKKI